MKKIKGIYIVQFEDKGIKFGISTNMINRIMTYKQPWCKKIDIAIGLEVQHPAIVEQRVKEQFEKNIVKPSHEFVRAINIETIKKFIFDNRLAKRDGMISNSFYINKTEWIDLNPIIDNSKFGNESDYMKEMRDKKFEGEW